MNVRTSNPVKHYYVGDGYFTPIVLAEGVTAMPSTYLVTHDSSGYIYRVELWYFPQHLDSINALMGNLNLLSDFDITSVMDLPNLGVHDFLLLYERAFYGRLLADHSALLLDEEYNDACASIMEALPVGREHCRQECLSSYAELGRLFHVIDFPETLRCRGKRQLLQKKETMLKGLHKLLNFQKDLYK